MSVQLLESAEKKPTCGPVILQTLWWPRHVVGIAGHARRSADEWRDDLIEHGGVRPGDVVDFIPEDVIGRMRLLVHHDGAYATENEGVPILGPSTRVYITDQGDTAGSIGDLVAMVHEAHKHKPELFPLNYQVRISIIRDVIAKRLEYVDDCVLKFQPA